jgi:voltage-gated potassium channel
MIRERRLLWLLSSLLFLIGTGTLVFHWIEKWSYLDSLYMTIVILSTVGLGEYRNLDSFGKLFTIILIFLGVMIAGFVFNAIGQRILENQWGIFLDRRKMEKEIKGLERHFIICGAGRVGRRVIKELLRSKSPFVVIEKDRTAAEVLAAEGCLTIVGDASDDDVLIRAGIHKARGLVTTISTDADNVYVTLTAKGLRPDIMVVTRAQEESAEKKLLKAGADRVIQPYQTAGQILARSVLKPNVVDFIESVTTGDIAKMQLQIEEIMISSKSQIVGLTLQQSEIRQNLGIIILAMKKKNGSMGFNPNSESVIEAGDCLIALGAAESLRRLEVIAE